MDELIRVLLNAAQAKDWNKFCELLNQALVKEAVETLNLFECLSLSVEANETTAVKALLAFPSVRAQAANENNLLLRNAKIEGKANILRLLLDVPEVFRSAADLSEMSSDIYLYVQEKMNELAARRQVFREREPFKLFDIHSEEAAIFYYIERYLIYRTKATSDEQAIQWMNTLHLLPSLRRYLSYPKLNVMELNLADISMNQLLLSEVPRPPANALLVLSQQLNHAYAEEQLLLIPDVAQTAPVNNRGLTMRFMASCKKMLTREIVDIGGQELMSNKGSSHPMPVVSNLMRLGCFAVSPSSHVRLQEQFDEYLFLQSSFKSPTSPQ